MKGHRSPGQTVLAISMKEDLLALLDDARLQKNESRSGFVRKALLEKLQSLGYEIGGDIITAPDRAKVNRAEDEFIPIALNIPPKKKPAREQAREESA